MSNGSCAIPTQNVATEKHLSYYLYLVYSIPTLVLHIAILNVLLTKKYEKIFRHSFYYLFAIDNISCIITMLTDLVFFRFITTGFFCDEMLAYFQESSIFLTITFTLSTHSGFCILYVRTLISINRLTAVKWPVKYRKMWSSFSPYVFLFPILLPFLSTWNIFLGTVGVTPSIEIGLDPLLSKFLNWKILSNSLQQAFMATVCGVAIVLSTLATFLFLFLARTNYWNYSPETALLLVGLAMASATVFTAVAFVGLYYALYIVERDENLVNQFFVVRLYATDFQTAVAPWTLLVMSKQVRKRVFAVFTRSDVKQKNENSLFTAVQSIASQTR